MFGICVEASHQRGMGHLFRALNLCKGLSERGLPFHIFINKNEASQTILEQRNLPFETVPLDSAKQDWQQKLIHQYGIKAWVDDRLNTDINHATQIKECDIALVTFDDRGSGARLADLNIAALAFDETELLEGNKVLRGPCYLPLNPEIARYKRLRNEQNRIVVSMGGSDTYGVTVKVIRLLKAAGRGATVVVGPAFQHENELNSVMDSSFQLKRALPSLMEEFSHYDLAITGGGITPFEANAAGLPCVVIANEDFEIPVGQGLAKLGGALFAGHHSQIDADLFTQDLPIKKMSQLGMERIDLNGTARILDEIEALI
jgi:spore coat polysaccharide biosynthesis predicted glycosyltransferase SpsG